MVSENSKLTQDQKENMTKIVCPDCGLELYLEQGFVKGKCSCGWEFTLNVEVFQQNELPDSRKEKNEYSDEHMNEAGFKFPRWLYVHELKSLLDELKPDDWVTPNQVGNLLVERGIDGKSKSIGFIDFHFNELEYFDEN